MAETTVAETTAAETMAESMAELAALEDHPTPPNCTAPHAPIWITEMVRRQDPDRRGRAS